MTLLTDAEPDNHATDLHFGLHGSNPGHDTVYFD